MNPKLGSIKDVNDGRDHIYKLVVQPVSIPQKKDYEEKMSKVKDQGRRSACVAFASCAIKEFQEGIQNLSEEFIYNQIKQPNGGAYPRDAMKLLTKKGVCHGSFLPYQNIDDAFEPKFDPKLHKDAFIDASFYKAQGYARIFTLKELLLSLTVNGPCLLAVNWHQSWFKPKDSLDGYPLINSTDGDSIGGHAVTACGFDQKAKVIKIRNSWNEKWGKKGYAYLSFDVIDKNLNDCWATYDVRA